MEGCEAFAWLLHSMEPTASSEAFADRESRSIAEAIAAAGSLGVNRGVYLGGIVPESAPSEHLRSRLSVEEDLLAALPDSTALRASIVIGARSRSFRFLVRLVERMPAVPLPAWQSFRTSPADVRDVVAALVTTLEGSAPGESLDISCPETVTYGELIALIAERLMLPRPTVELPFSLTAMAGPIAAALTGEDRELIGPLMGSLGADLLPRASGLERLGIRPHSLEAAIDRALGDWEKTEELATR